MLERERDKLHVDVKGRERCKAADATEGRISPCIHALTNRGHAAVQCHPAFHLRTVDLHAQSIVPAPPRHSTTHLDLAYSAISVSATAEDKEAFAKSEKASAGSCVRHSSPL